MKSKVEFKQKYIAYLDVLGFSNIVNSDNKDAIHNYLKLIEEWRSRIKSINKDLEIFDFLTLSDSIIICVDKSERDFKSLLLACQRIQKHFLQNNIYLRGAISFGECYFDKKNNIVVGKGLISAFLLEKEARFPRIIIDPKIILDMGITRAVFIEKFKYFQDSKPIKLIFHYYYSSNNKASTDALYIDYVTEIIYSFYTNEGDNLNLIYENLYKNMYSSQLTYEKYNWLKNYIIDSLEDFKFYKFEKNDKSDYGRMHLIQEKFEGM